MQPAWSLISQSYFSFTIKWKVLIYIIYIKELYSTTKWDLFQRFKAGFNIQNSHVIGTFQVAQQWRIHLPMQDMWVIILGSGKSPREENGNPPQDPCLKKISWTEEPGRLQSMGSQRVGCDWVTDPIPIHLTCHLSLSFHFYPSIPIRLEKAMAPHSSALAWKTPWMEEPGGLQSMGLRRVGHDLSNFTFTFHFHALEKEMETHSSVLVWRIPGKGEPGGLPSMESHRVGHDWSDLAAAAEITLP